MDLIKLPAVAEGICQNFCGSRRAWSNLLQEGVELVKWEMGDWSVLLLEQVGLVKFWEKVRFFKVSPGVGGDSQIFVVVGRIGQTPGGSRRNRSEFLWDWARLVRLSLGFNGKGSKTVYTHF